ncbi:MAG: hypothetical protein IKH33_03750 [Bacteroidales bacterium]|nr:hypothetical protein [Bacteroidales bacterium]
MQFRLSYAEVEQFSESKAGKRLPLSYNDTHTVRISYPVPLMGSVGVDITVDRINGSDVFLSFGGGAAIEFMLRTALNQAKNQPGMEMVQMLGGNQLLLNLGKSPNLAPILERINLEDICFDEQFIIIQFSPKNDLV